jgi:hypothetical protein
MSADPAAMLACAERALAPRCRGPPGRESPQNKKDRALIPVFRCGLAAYSLREEPHICLRQL